MIRNLKTVILLISGILFIRVALSEPVATPDDIFSLGVNFLTRTAKSTFPNLGFRNKQLFSFSDPQSRTYVVNTERNTIQGLMQKTFHPSLGDSRHYYAKKDTYGNENKLNARTNNVQWNTNTEQNIGRLSSTETSQNNVVGNSNQATESSSGNFNLPLNNNDLLVSNKYGTETTVISSEETTAFTTDSTETTTESDEISNRILPPQVVATLLG